MCEGEGEEGWLGVVRPNRAAPRLAGRAETQQRAPTHSVARDPVINNAPADSQPPPTFITVKSKAVKEGAPYYGAISFLAPYSTFDFPLITHGEN